MIRFGPHIDGYQDCANQFADDLRRRAEAHFRRQERERAQIASIAEFEARRKRIQTHFLDAIGGLPTERTPLNLQIAGTVQRNGYRIEKIIYESVPNFYVTAALYIPDGVRSPQPAVVFLHGHADSGKSYPVYQAVCADLASAGFVVMAIDPLGQGERFQYVDPDSGKRLIGGCTTDHTHAGMQFTAAGASIARHFIWDVMRGIDYLETRPEVDAGKIGVTGNSGGGTQSSLLMMCEPRLAAAVPCTFIMTLESYMKTGQGQDSEQIVPGCFAHGPDHDDYITAMAPKPVLVGSVAYDYFPIEGALEAVQRAKRIYALYNAAENVDIVISDARHEYTPKLRQACVNWFKKHLKHETPDFQTGDPETLPEEQLWATSKGQVLLEYPGSLTAHHLNRIRVRSERRERKPLTAETARAAVMKRLAIDGDRGRPIYPRVIYEGETEGFPVEKIYFFSEPDIAVTGALISPQNGEKPARTDIVLFDGGTNDAENQKEWIREQLSNGLQLFLFDVRGTGAVSQRPFNRGGEPYTAAYKLACDAMMLGLSTTGMRVFDVLRAYDYLRSRPDIGNIGAAGFERGAIYGYCAAALETGFQSARLYDMLCSYQELIDTQYYDRTRYHLDILPYGALKDFDLPDLLPCFENRALAFERMRSPDGRILSEAEQNERFWNIAAERGYAKPA